MRSDFTDFPLLREREGYVLILPLSHKREWGRNSMPRGRREGAKSTTRVLYRQHSANSSTQVVEVQEGPTNERTDVSIDRSAP